MPVAVVIAASLALCCAVYSAARAIFTPAWIATIAVAGVLGWGIVLGTGWMEDAVHRVVTVAVAGAWFVLVREALAAREDDDGA